MVANTPSEAVRLLCEGITEHDVDKALRYYESDAIFVHPADGTEHRGTAEIREALSGLIALKPTLTIHGFRKEIINGNLAFVSADHVLDGETPDGNPVSIEGTTTDVARFTPGEGWKLIIDNPGGLA